MVVVDGLLLTMCLRFVGVPAADVATSVVLGVFLLAYPLTFFPLAGLGVLDAVVLAALVETGGLALEPEIVAGIVVYRVITLLAPLAVRCSVHALVASREGGDMSSRRGSDHDMRIHQGLPDDVVSQVSTGRLPMPDEIKELLAAAHRSYRDVADGAVADYIPALAAASPDLFGIAVAGVGGRVFGVGDASHPFTIQSVAKPFVFALVCEALGHREVRSRLGVNATGLPFDSVMAVELAADGLTNPMVNSGAIATTSLVPGRTSELKWRFLREGLSRFAGRDLEVDEAALDSELATNGRNEALARLLVGHGRIYFDPDETTDVYTRQGALVVTATDLAVMGATLADGGVNPVTRRARGQPGHLSAHAGADAHRRASTSSRATGSTRSACPPRAASAAGSSRSPRARAGWRPSRRRWTRRATASAASWRPSCSPRRSGSTCWPPSTEDGLRRRTTRGVARPAARRAFPASSPWAARMARQPSTCSPLKLWPCPGGVEKPRARSAVTCQNVTNGIQRMEPDTSEPRSSSSQSGRCRIRSGLHQVIGSEGCWR